MILNSSGRPLVCLGGETAHHTRLTGDIVSSYQWINGEPAMVLFPRERKMGAGAFVVCMSSAYLYAETAYLVMMAVKAAEVMGMDMEKSTVRRIADVIIDGLEELVRMPEDPPEDMKVPGKPLDREAMASLKVDGETLFEREIKIDGSQMQ